MLKFALQKIDAVVGKQQFDKLLIDGNAQFDEFEKNLEQQYKSELIGIYNTMNNVANLKTVPKEKFHYYNKEKGDYREFEYKSSHLRVYGITKKNGQIIILGGTKAKQQAEEKEFRSIKKKYLASL